MAFIGPRNFQVHTHCWRIAVAPNTHTSICKSMRHFVAFHSYRYRTNLSSVCACVCVRHILNVVTRLHTHTHTHRPQNNVLLLGGADAISTHTLTLDYKLGLNRYPITVSLYFHSGDSVRSRFISSNYSVTSFNASVGLVGGYTFEIFPENYLSVWRTDRHSSHMGWFFFREIVITLRQISVANCGDRARVRAHATRFWAESDRHQHRPPSASVCA